MHSEQTGPSSAFPPGRGVVGARVGVGLEMEVGVRGAYPDRRGSDSGTPVSVSEHRSLQRSRNFGANVPGTQALLAASKTVPGKAVNSELGFSFGSRV